MINFRAGVFGRTIQKLRQIVVLLVMRRFISHEFTHWTGSKTRLDRDFGGHRFGSEGYAVEELVAELGAAFLCADLELALEPREDHASYIATWLKLLAADNRAVFTVAAPAQRAAELINRGVTEAAQVTTTCAA